MEQIVGPGKNKSEKDASAYKFKSGGGTSKKQNTRTVVEEYDDEGDGSDGGSESGGSEGSVSEY